MTMEVASARIENILVELWNATTFDFEDDDHYALVEAEVDVGRSYDIIIQDYFGDRTGHRVDAFAQTPDGCREIPLIGNTTSSNGDDG